MNGPDRTTADTRSALLARLQATMPPANGESPVLPKNGEKPIANGNGAIPRSDSASRPDLPPRLQQTRLGAQPDPNSVTSLAPQRYPSASREPYQPRYPEPKQKRSIWALAGNAIAVHGWLIAALLVAGGILGYFGTTQIAVTVYRVQASLELENNDSDSSAETVARVLQSQSLISAALSTMPDSQRVQLSENPRMPLFRQRSLEEHLREHLKVTTTPLGQVIDLDLITPNRQAGVDFMNALIHALMQRTLEQKVLGAGAGASGAQASTGATISIIDPALASTEPVGPNLILNVLLGILCGGLAGTAFALIRQFATTTFGGPGSISQVLGVRELGAIPERKLLASPDASDSAALQMDANDESLRYLRSSLLYRPGRQDVRYIAFTSAAPGEGKTTVVTNLSMSLAATGRRVLVIDGDLRRPRLYRILQVAQGPGLSDLLRRDPAGPPAVLSKFVAPTSFQNLYVLPPGSAGSDVPELLAGPLLAKLLRDLGKSFDFVLIDTPPLLACSDARNYARAAEGVVLVVRSSETQKRAALVARDMLLQDGANIIGTVLTGWRNVYPAYSYPSAVNYARTQ